MINMDSRTYRLTGMTEILGSQPASETIRSEYIASKAPNAELADEETELMKMEEKGLTVFLRDPDHDDRLILLDYTVRAFFKSAFDALKEQIGIKAVRNKIDKYVFVSPRSIPILREGADIVDEDGILERPLRAETMQGPRVALAASERIDTPWSIEFTVTLIPNGSSPKSPAIKWEDIENALDYGALQGIGQWRSGSYGRFTWERIDDANQPTLAQIKRRGEIDVDE